MGDQKPTRFENYPPDSVPDVGPGGSSEPVSDHEGLTVYPPPQVYPPPRPGPSRRGFLVGGLVAGAAVLGVVALVPRTGTRGLPDSEMSSAMLPADSDQDGDDGSVAVGEYSADRPSGWKQTRSGDRLAVLTAGSDEVMAVALDVDGAASDDILDEVEQRRGRFRGTLRSRDVTADDSISSDNARVVVAGTLDGKPARLIAQLWVSSGDTSALLVIQTLTSAAGSKHAKQAQAVADELSSDF